MSDCEHDQQNMAPFKKTVCEYCLNESYARIDRLEKALACAKEALGNVRDEEVLKGSPPHVCTHLHNPLVASLRMIAIDALDAITRLEGSE